ncbi:hypothetical protein EGW08_022008 [Elysia chlorotica]|uniref:CUB domain-containing protein n=1 Tax=Elysia chlorotica TaxID=188477 RepID=A0A433SM29_ELYCH|nr:hypothetical protein EGW08_022008 [Elysia chlorotica]
MEVDNADLIGKFCGPTESIPGKIKSTGNTMSLNFVTNSYGIGKGFSGEYYATYGPAVGCGGNLTQPFGTITSLDIDGDGKYEHNLECEWTIKVDPDKIIVFNVTDMALEGHMPNCDSDYIQLFDGPTKQDSKIFKKCGNTGAPFFVKTTTNEAMFQFRTSIWGAREGFNVTFSQEDRICGGLLTATTQPQTLIFPGSAGPVSGSLRCAWTLDSGLSDTQVKVSSNELSIGSDCSKNFIEIRDKPRGTHGLIRTLCNSTTPHTFYSRRRMANIIYQQDASSAGTGFNLTYEQADCHQVYTSSAGRITSPNYPDNYHHHLNCRVAVYAPEGSFLSFYIQNFHMEGFSSSTCPYDHMVITGSNTTTGEMCGSTIPDPVFLNGPNGTVDVTTDYSINHSGFAITFVASTTGKGCGGNLTNAVPGFITSPYFPISPQGPMNCVWTLQSPQRIKVKINSLGSGSADEAGYCQDTYLEISGGPHRQSWGRYCTVMEGTIYQQNLRFTYFVAPGNVTGTRFKLTFSYMDD